MRKILEICVDTVVSAKNADTAKASRIELCSSLQSGGVTPSFATIEKITNTISIPVNVLIRPRSGNFYYTNDEFEIICKDIEKIKTLNVNGFVSGVLDKFGNVDKEKTKQLVEISKPFDFTFHRAIDNTTDYIKNIKSLINCGVMRMLTSGASSSISLGMTNLKKSFSEFKNDIIIMPGGGLNFDNVRELIDYGFSEYHFSASEFIEDNCYNNKDLLGGMGHYIHNSECGYMYSDRNKIEKMISILTRQDSIVQKQN
ncbi:hypothetical protein LJC11_05345 [Bacteroidales bacterium OttesenSCG-928-I21]|nr:hypothetical protein [Bacteroidales bacterium OttesenSCG-928-I21]